MFFKSLDFKSTNKKCKLNEYVKGEFWELFEFLKVHRICDLGVAIDIKVVSLLPCIGLAFSPLYTCCICSEAISFRGAMKCFLISPTKKK